MDFETFSISGPRGSDELDGGLCSIDAFSVLGQIQAENSVPIICGENAGQHSKINRVSQQFFLNFSFIVYVDLDSRSEVLLTLEFTFTGRMLRRWQLKSSFIPCFALLR